MSMTEKKPEKKPTWTANSKITMDIKKSDDAAWKTNKKVVMQFNETLQNKEKK